MKIVNEAVMEKLENKIEKGRPNFLVFCYDIPSEFHTTISEQEKALLMTKRITFKNYLDKWSIFVSNSVYMINYEHLQSLIEYFENQYEDLADKYDIDLKLLGMAFDMEMVKEMIVERIKTVERDVKNFFEYVLDTKTITEKKELLKMRRTYKSLIKKLNIIINYRLKDLALLDRTLSEVYSLKLMKMYDSRGIVNERIKGLTEAFGDIK